MKKVLSVALASAMVLGMGANAFAITYNTSTNDKADWPSNFKFDGALFVTNSDGDIITDATTAINDNESVDFMPGDVVWMPLYANDQYEYSNTWTEGTESQDAVSNVKLGADYFTEGQTAKDPSVGETAEVKKSFNAEVKLGKAWTTGDLSGTVTVGTQQLGTATVTGATDKATVTFKISSTEYKTVFGEDAPSGYSEVEVTTSVAKADDFDDTDDTATVSLNNVVIATYKKDAANGQAAKAATLNSIPTEIEVTNGKTSTKRTVESAKAVVNGKTFKATKPSEFATLIANVNKELEAMAAAGKSAMIKDVVVTVNLAKIDGTKDVIGKPVIVEGDKVVVNGQMNDEVVADYGHYTGNIDKNWSINLIEGSTGVSELIEKAELYKATATDYASYSKYTDEIMPNAVYLKITLKDQFKTITTETLKYYVYIADNAGNHKTNEVWVSGTYSNKSNVKTVNFTWTNDASQPAIWKVAKGENGVAVFDFADKAFFTVKMYSGESMYLDLSTAYDKAIAGEMDAEADSFFKFDNENANFSRTGELVIVSDDSSLVPYEIDKDGNFVEVDAQYVKGYAIAHTNEKVNGFVFNTKALGNYVLSTEELGQEEAPVKETPVVEEPTTENTTTTTETAKPNPETGAEDFVGLAVSLAVVSVAAAGALALKK